LLDILVEPETGGDFRVARVSEDLLAAADQDRNVLDPHVESVEHLLDAGIALDVEERVGLTVARQELLYPKRSRGLARTDEDFTHAALNQLDPPQNERPEEELGELTVGLQNLKRRLRSSSSTRVGSVARRRRSPGRPDNMLTSPVNCPGRRIARSSSPARDVRTSSA
jgi:hypothetical protein